MVANFLLIVVFTGIIPVIIVTSTLENRPTLQSVQVVFRHGKRHPDANYTAEERTGLLANEGKEEMFDLGKLTRQRYSHFLKEDYDPAEVKVITSAALRCVQSGALFAYGLYEKYNSKANWSRNPTIRYDPIPIQPIPSEFDKYLQISDDCPRRKEIKLQLSNDFYNKLVSTNLQIQNFLYGCATARNDSSLLDEKVPGMDRVYSCLSYIEPSVGDEHEEWAEPYVPLYDSVMRSGQKEALNSSIEFQQLQNGPFLEMIYSKMNRKNEIEQKKLYAYASHDFTINAIRILFEQEMKSFPIELPTASAFFLEIHQVPQYDEPVLEIYFRNSSESSVMKIKDIRGCSPVCFVSNFGKIIQPYIPENYEELCKLSPKTDSSSKFSAKPASRIVQIFIGITIVFGLAATLFVVFKLSASVSAYEQL